jgi:hypothetical protein
MASSKNPDVSISMQPILSEEPDDSSTMDWPHLLGATYNKLDSPSNVDFSYLYGMNVMQIEEDIRTEIAGIHETKQADAPRMQRIRTLLSQHSKLC